MEESELPSVEKIEINALIHATEDDEKIEKAVSSLISAEIHPPLIKISSLSGHYGNPIRLMTLIIKSKDHLSRILKDLIGKLPSKDKASLLEELPLHIAKNGTLFIRLDKQAVARGIVSLGREDPIQIKIKFRSIQGRSNLIDPLERMLKNA
ncbi:MAG: RNA-binding domain-containing protein [Candidatus Bathyarchaeia archaeon]